MNERGWKYTTVKVIDNRQHDRHSPQGIDVGKHKQCKEKINKKKKEAYVDTLVSFTIQIVIPSS